jgi:hypothetical protein
MISCSNKSESYSAYSKYIDFSPAKEAKMGNAALSTSKSTTFEIFDYN